MIKTFLKAEWRKLAMVNYVVDQKILQKYLPPKTEIDLWNSRCYVSLVGFMFLNTRLKGWKIPFHSNFEEVNLRFYVRFRENDQWKRGVVFLKEIVPKAALTFVANAIYHENYETMPMAHRWESRDDSLTVEYKWKDKRWNSLRVVTDKNPIQMAVGSEEEFITEHFWGYTKISEAVTSEYGVEHPRWEVYKTLHFEVDVDFGKIYGSKFDFLKDEKPASVFLAEGSEIEVKEGRKI